MNDDDYHPEAVIHWLGGRYVALGAFAWVLA